MIDPLLAHVRELLSAQDEDRIHCVGMVPLPAGEFALSEGSPGPTLALVLRSIQHSPLRPDPIALLGTSLGEGDISLPPLLSDSGGARVVLRSLPVEVVLHSDQALGVILQGIRGSSFILEGEVVPWKEGAYVVHVATCAAVRIVDADDEVLILCDPEARIGDARHGVIAAYRIVRAVPAAIRELERWTPPRSPRLDVDVLAQMLGDASCEAWLRRQVEILGAVPSPADRVAAAGLLGRLWMPTTGAERALFAEAGAEGPGDRVRAWAERLERPMLEYVARTAARRAEELTAELGTLETTARLRPGAVGKVAARVVHARDDLESISYVIRLAGGSRSEELDSALRAFDDEAADHLSVFAFADGLAEDERIRAVSWQDPNAWWGGLAES